MQEIRLWKIDAGATHKAKADVVQPIDETATEQLLEDVLATSPEPIARSPKVIATISDSVQLAKMVLSELERN